VPFVVVNYGSDHDETFIYAKKQVGHSDGYWLSTMSGSLMTYYYTRATGVGVKDYTPVILAQTSPIFFAVKADAPWQTVKELEAYCNDNPGRVRIATGGSGWNLVTAYWWQVLTGVDVVIMPVASSGEAILTVLGGGAEVAAMSISRMKPQVEAGKARALCTVEGERVPIFPDVPTFKESGYPEMDYSHFRGVVASAQVSQERFDWLSALFGEAAGAPEFKEYVEKRGQFVLNYSGKRARDYVMALDKVADEVTLAAGMQTQ
jgi:tripartite-type tricarboxylate transporter receptor subunit TctC